MAIAPITVMREFSCPASLYHPVIILETNIPLDISGTCNCFDVAE